MYDSISDIHWPRPSRQARFGTAVIGAWLLLTFNISAQEGLGYAGFPAVATAAKPGEVVLAPSFQSIEKALGGAPAKTTFIFYAQKMVAPGSNVSRVAYLSGEKSLANNWLVALPKGGRAKVGDIVLTWWQSGSGMQRAIVVGAADPARPLVRYLDLAYDNPAKAKDKITPIGQMEEQLAADSFVQLAPGAPGSVHRCMDEGTAKRFQLITRAANGEMLLLGFGGKLARLGPGKCTPVPLAPKLVAGQKAEVAFTGSFRTATIERVDRRIGRAWVTIFGRPSAIAFGDIIPE